MEEQQAIVLLKQGDNRGLEVLVQLYYLQAVRASYLIIQDKQLAEDTVQTSFINLIHKIHQFDESRSFRPWFLRSVVNRSISICRQHNRHTSIDDFDESIHPNKVITLLSETNMEEISLNLETRQAVWQALQRLTHQQRAAIVMRYYLEFSEVDISREMERPKSSVKWLLFSARRKLRQLLSYMREDDPIQKKETDK